MHNLEVPRVLAFTFQRYEFLHSSDDFRAYAKYCVVAVPLAQLALNPLPTSSATNKSPSTGGVKPEEALSPTTGLIDFSPPLGADRLRALARYRMGCHNKVRHLRRTFAVAVAWRTLTVKPFHASNFLRNRLAVRCLWLTGEV